MRRGISFFLRLGAVVVLLIFGFQLAMIASASLQRGKATDTGLRFPLPDQVAASITLLETGQDRSTVLRALNGQGVSVILTDTPFEEFAGEQIHVTSVERALAAYETELGGRRFAAFVEIPQTGFFAERRARRRPLLSGSPLRVVVELTTGEVLVIETVSQINTQVFGLPLGFFAGMIGVIISGMVLVYAHRQTQPMLRLSKAAADFGQDGAPQIVAEQGAPEMRSLIREVNNMQVRVSDLLASRALTLGAIGHDLRTYLARLRLRIDLVPEDDLRIDMNRDAQNLSDMLDDSILLARLGLEPLGDERTELNEVLDKLVADASQQGHDISMTAFPTDLQVRGKRAAIQKLFQNLIGNATKFATQTKITMSDTPEDVIIEIADNGPGIPEAERKKVMQPFYNANDARTLGKSGTGLGLAIAREIALNCGGDLVLEANNPSGLRCRVVLKSIRSDI